MSAWKEKRKKIKKMQKVKQLNKDKLHDKIYTISEIQSFSTISINNNNTEKFEPNTQKENLNIIDINNKNNFSIENVKSRG
jgi:hypothetical protein